VSERAGRHILLAVRNRLALVVVMAWAKATGQRWFLEWDGVVWQVIKD